MKYVVPIFLLCLISTSNLNAETKFDISLKILPTTWGGNNDNGDIDFESKDTQRSLGFGFQNDNLYGRITLQGGQFGFSDPAPAQETKTERTMATNVDIDHGESDFILGYYFWRQVSLFADIKSIENNWKDSDYDMSYSGLGLGVSGFHPFSQELMLYGSFAVMLPATIESGGDNIGRVAGSTLDFGVSYRWFTQSQVFGGIKLQANDLDFDNGNNQTHTRGGLYFGAQYQF